MAEQNKRTYARVIGRIEWICPDCKHMNSSPTDPNRQYGRCKYKNCHRVILFGVRLHKTGTGHKHRPTRDWYMTPGMYFNAHVVDRHEDGMPANDVVEVTGV